MEDTSVTEVKLVFSRCDICGKEYGENETKIRDVNSEYSEEDSQRQEPLLLLCDSCTVDLSVLPTFNPSRLT